MLMMWFHFVRGGKWKNTLLTLMQEDKSLVFFHLVKLEDVDRSTLWDYNNIAGTHFFAFKASVSHRNVTLLKLRDLACFCPECMDDNPNFYGNKSHVHPWKLYSLEPINVTQVNKTFFHIFHDTYTIFQIQCCHALLFQISNVSTCHPLMTYNGLGNGFLTCLKHHARHGQLQS